MFLVLVVVLLLCMVEGWSHYEVLQVHRNDSPSKIREAYRNIAYKYHPDRGNASEVELRTEFIQAVNAAKELLLDPRRRYEYNNRMPTRYITPNATSYKLNPFKHWQRYRELKLLDQFLKSFEKKQAAKKLADSIERKSKKEAQRKEIAKKIVMIGGAAAAVATIGGGVTYLNRIVKNHRCNTCIANSIAEVGTANEACHKSLDSCKKYFAKLAHQCKKVCSVEQVMGVVNSYFLQMLQNQSEPMVQLIQNSSSMQELQPAVNFVNKLKHMENKTLRKFRFRKTLATKLDRMIHEKQNKLRGVEPFSFGNEVKQVLSNTKKGFEKLRQGANKTITTALTSAGLVLLLLKKLCGAD